MRTKPSRGVLLCKNRQFNDRRVSKCCRMTFMRHNRTLSKSPGKTMLLPLASGMEVDATANEATPTDSVMMFDLVAD